RGVHALHVFVEVLAHIHGGFFEHGQRLEQRGFVVERLAGVGHKNRGDAQRFGAYGFNDKGGRSGVPGGVAAGLEGVAQATVGEARSVGLLLHQGRALEVFNRPSVRVELLEIFAGHVGPHCLQVEHVLAERLGPAVFLGRYRQRLALVDQLEGFETKNSHENKWMGTPAARLTTQLDALAVLRTRTTFVPFAPHRLPVLLRHARSLICPLSSVAPPAAAAAPLRPRGPGARPGPAPHAGGQCAVGPAGPRLGCRLLRRAAGGGVWALPNRRGVPGRSAAWHWGGGLWPGRVPAARARAGRGKLLSVPGRAGAGGQPGRAPHRAVV
nr:hypothetical protein [Tanacetum cinerariifolium]